MTQFARPASDITVGGWLPTPIAPKLSEVIADDNTTKVSVTLNGTSDTFEVKLSNLLGPVRAGHTIRIRTACGTVPGAFLVELYESTILRASFAADDGSGLFNTTTYVLSAAEANSISDYQNLRVRVRAEETLFGITVFDVTWIELEVPDITPPFYDIFLWARPDE